MCARARAAHRRLDPGRERWHVGSLVMTKTRTETDTFGPIAVPAERLWGAQTQRSLHHFHISTEKMPLAVVYALALVKKAVAIENVALGELDSKLGDAIVRAADEVLAKS